MNKGADKSREELIEKLVSEKLEGKSYSKIRARLSAEGMPGEEISALIRKVDEKVLEAATSQGGAIRARQWYRAGFILAVAGLLIAVAFNSGMIFENRAAILIYSPFIAGILIMFYGRMLQRQGPEKKASTPGPIRRRRPFK